MTGWMLGLIIAATGISCGVLIGAVLWRPKHPKPAKPPKPQLEPEGVTGDIGAAGATPPPELAPDRFDHTLALPELNNETIAIGAPPDRVSVAEMAGAFQGGPDSVTWLRDQRALEAPTEPAEPLHLPTTTATSVAPWRPPSYDPGTAAADVSTWRPPDPRVVLTVAWKRPNAPLIAGRYDITEEQPLPDEVVPLYHAMQSQQIHYGGDITVAVKVDGHGRDDWEWTANQEWPRQSIDAIRQARDQLQRVGADA